MEYEFNDDDDQATLVVQPEATPFPDISAEAPGILTEHEEIHGASPLQDEPTQSNEEQAALAAENIRSSNQDDTDGTSSIVLPCPSS